MKKISIFIHSYHPATGGLENLSKKMVEILKNEYEINIFTGKGLTLDSYKTFSNWTNKYEDQSMVRRLNLNTQLQRFANRFFYKLVVKFGILSHFYFGPILKFTKKDHKIISESDLIIAIGMPTMSLYYGYNFSKKYNIPLIVLPAYHFVNYYNKVFVFQKALNRAVKIIYLSQYEISNIKKSYKIDISKCTKLTYSPYNIDKIRKLKDSVQSNDQKDSGNKVLTIGYVGQITRRKNLSEIAMLSKQLKDKNITHRVILAGQRTNTSDEVKEYFDEVEDLEVLYNFKDSEKESIYDKIDVFINPSIEESFGIVNLEAMFYKCVLCTRYPFLEGEKSPFVYDDLEKLVSYIESFKDDKLHYNKVLQEQISVLENNTYDKFKDVLLETVSLSTRINQKLI